MFSVIVQVWWLWAVLFGIVLFVITVTPVKNFLTDGHWRNGPWSISVFFILLLICLGGYSLFSAGILYVYNTPLEDLQIKSPEVSTELTFLYGLTLPFLLFAEMIRPFLPCLLGAVPILIIFAIAVGVIRKKVRKEATC